MARLRGDPLRHELAEAVLLDLAARGHRKLADDLDPLGKLVLGELLAIEERGDLRQRDGLPVARDHHRARALDEPRVRHRHDRHAGDLGMRVEHVLDLRHRDVLAAADDQVLGAPGDGDVPVAVERGAVAGPEPPVRGVGLGGERRPPEVPDELRGASHEEIALRAGRQGAAVVVDHAQLHAGPRGAIGVEDLVLPVAKAVAGDEPVLGHAPAGRDCAPQARARVAHQRARDRRTRRDEDPQGAEIVPRLGVGQISKERRGAHRERHALGLDKPRGLEDVPGVHPHRRRAEQHVETVAVEIAGLMTERRRHQ